MSERPDLRGTLSRVLRDYRRWVSEGKPPYSASYDPQNRRPQYYYDPYHDAITELGEDRYRFRIQTFDSPEGDTWVGGTFQMGSDGLTIEESHVYRN